MDPNKTREYYIALLREKSRQSLRLPKKSDFTNEEVSRIKSFWGPWRRALEAAGLIAEKSTKKNGGEGKI